MPSREIPGAPRTLPAELTSFVGRHDEVATVKRALGAARLLTLTGPGGVGKTRLALRCAREVERHHRDGACFVNLAEVEDPNLVTRAVFGALGLQDRSAEWSLEMLIDYLADRQLLLVLDNCEHVLDPAALLAGTLLGSCPELRILATSRQALGVAGEFVQRVPPLSLPEAPNASPADALGSDGVSLFVERASATQAQFTLDGESTPLVLELCRRLDGVPLALELAAVRLDALGLEGLVAGLAERLDVLGTDRSHERRHRTMDATIDWSYRLLTEQERLLWTRLSVFAGGFELDAAVDVCADEAIPADGIPLVLASLVERSLVKRGRVGGRRERFLVLEVLRQFARRRLEEAGDEAAFRRRHAEWCSRLAEVVATQDDQLADAFARLRAEGPNLWSALELCLEVDVERGIQICRDLFNYWLADGHVSRVSGILIALLERDRIPGRPRGEALWVLALLATTGSDARAGRRAAEEALTIGRSIGAADVVTWALVGLASASWVEGDWEAAIATATEAATLGELMGLGAPRLTAMNVIATSRGFQGDADGAIDVGRRALALSRELGETWLRGYTIYFLARALLDSGQRAEATRLAREGVEIARDLQHTVALGSLADLLARDAIVGGDPERAATLLGGADAIWGSISWQHTPASRAQHDELRAAVRAVLGPGRYDHALHVGLVMTLAELADYALGGSLPARRSVPTSPDPSTILSRRELEVARLVAEGATNAQTAAQLFIGERTVESHVASIFNKLGVDSRVQVARWVASLDARAEV